MRREGLRVLNPLLFLSNLNGWWFKTEYAYQNHADFDMKAQAAYGALGYVFNTLPWKPNISYRYSFFSGDDPSTPTYERFDPLLSGGLAEWGQGINFKKVSANLNPQVHWVRLGVNPRDTL